MTPFKVGCARSLAVLALLGTCWPALAGEAAPVPGGYVPSKVQQKAPALFPRRLLTDGILQGEALLVIEIGQTGELRDLLTVAYSHRAFAESATEAVRQWKFTPASVGGETLISRIDIRFSFEVSGIVVYEKNPIESLDRYLTQHRLDFRPFRADELDTPVRTVEQSSPIYPRDWIRQGRQGEVTIDFFIDEQGVVRMPAPLPGGDEWLASAAMIAIKDWRFTPPRRNKAPVLVHAQQLFVFRPPPQKPGGPS